MSAVIDAIKAPTMHKPQTLLQVAMLPGEEVVLEFVQKPSCDSCCWRGSGVIRRVQLTTHRLSYLETYRKHWCSSTPSSMRQVFVKDICDFATDNYRGVEESWLERMSMLVLKAVFPVVGIALVFVDIGGIDFGSTELKFSQLVGIPLIVIGLLAIIFRTNQNISQQVIIGTRCPQLPAFAITLNSFSARIELLDALSRVIAKQQ